MISKRIQDVQSPVIPIVAAWTKEVPGAISLGQGIVHYDPPSAVETAIRASLSDGPSLHRYGPVTGNPELLHQIERKLESENQIRIDEDNSIVCTAGANMAFLHAILAFAEIDDEVILISPYYFNHHMAIAIAGCRPVVVPSLANHQPDLNRIESAITDRTRAIVTVSPNNPTGAVYPEDTLGAINQLCGRHGLYHLSDEAYEYFHHGESRHVSPAARAGTSNHTISLFSLSKSYGLAGWRVGYSVVPRHLLEGIRKIQDTNLICPPIICQRAATAALTVGSEWCRAKIPALTSVRDAALSQLRTLEGRVRINHPKGAFYIFLNLTSEMNDLRLVELLIRDHGVAVLPGSAFGVNEGCSLRLSYGALDSATVSEGIGRLVNGLEKLIHQAPN